MSERARVLVVDDEEPLRAVLRHLLLDEGYEVTEAGSGEAALALFGPGKFDLVVLDKNLPALSGVEVARRMRESDDDVALVLITAYGTVESAVELLHLRVAAYLEKPFEDIYAVARTFADVLARRRRQGSTTAIDHFKRARQALGGKARSPATTAPKAALRCVVVSASAPDRDVVGRHLERGGHTVARVASGGEALAAAERGADLVVVDAGIEAPDVHTLVPKLRELWPEVVCAVLTEGSTVKSVARLMELDVRAVLQKPVDDESVARRLGPIVERLALRER